MNFRHPLWRTAAGGGCSLILTLFGCCVMLSGCSTTPPDVTNAPEYNNYYWPRLRAPTPKFDPAMLKPGDILLYAPSDLVGDIIAVKTGRLKSHVEAYVGNGMVFAARSEGVNLYPVRIDATLASVRRHPNWQSFDKDKAWPVIADLKGKSYDTWGLFSFFDPWHTEKEVRVCSTVDTMYLRAGGLEPFNPDLASSGVTPASWFETGGMQTIWRNPIIDRLSPPK